MRGEIRDLQERLGITAIYVTHDQEEAMSISDTMLVMNQGRVEQVGSPLDIYRKPATEFVADFIGMTNFLRGTIKSTDDHRMLVSIYNVSFELPADDRFEEGEPVTIVTRPEALRFSESEEVAFKGTIHSAFFLGSLVRYEIAVGDGDLITMDDSNPVRLLAKGSKVKLEIIPYSIYLKKVEKAV
jgi:ABC-type Fe3+/spermidine/putrescine transport system ATPase subunit